jgi:hypothetical protein
MTLQEIYKLPTEERRIYFPVKYRKYSWAGWYVRWEWRYNCPFCKRKGFTECGFRNHLMKAHDFGYSGAYCLIKDAVHVPEFDNKNIKIGVMSFKVQG